MIFRALYQLENPFVTTSLTKRYANFVLLCTIGFDPASTKSPGNVTILLRQYQPSPLFMAIKPAFAPAAQIEHSKYGLGSVLSCNEEHIVIKFDDHGEKKFVLSIALAALKKSDRQPPVEKRRATRKKAVPVAAAAAKSEA
jgi:hypothetical protein